jgi:hypothetical protein
MAGSYPSTAVWGGIDAQSSSHVLQHAAVAAGVGQAVCAFRLLGTAYAQVWPVLLVSNCTN